MDSILTTVKLGLNPRIEEDCYVFDNELIMHINSALFTLSQLGIGPEEGIKVQDSLDQWSALEINDNTIGLVKEYITLKVQKTFDPPQSGAHNEALSQMIAEAEWRLCVASDSQRGGVNDE